MPHHTASKEAVGQLAVHESTVSSLSLGMLGEGAWGCSQQHLQQPGSTVQDIQLIFMGKLWFRKVPAGTSWPMEKNRIQIFMKRI